MKQKRDWEEKRENLKRNNDKKRVKIKKKETKIEKMRVDVDSEKKTMAEKINFESRKCKSES